MKTYDATIKFLREFEEETGMNSYADFNANRDLVIEKLKNSGCIDIVREDIITFLDILTKDKFYMGQLVLENEAYNIKYIYIMYLMCLYFDRLDAYRDLSKYLSVAVEKLGIIEYKGITEGHLDAMLKKTFTMEEGIYDGHRSFEIKHKYKDSTKYVAYDKVYDQYFPRNIYDTNDIFMWSEHRTLDDEYTELKEYAQEKKLVWVSRTYGDGFGYDVLSIDPFTRREKLIEVKARTSTNLDMTFNEVKVMREAHKNDADYYVYRYYIQPGYFILDKLRYDPTIDELIDQNNNHYVIGEPYPSKVNNKGETQYTCSIDLKEKVKLKDTNNN